jgi:hypothetical protein
MNGKHDRITDNVAVIQGDYKRCVRLHKCIGKKVIATLKFLFRTSQLEGKFSDI